VGKLRQWRWKKPEIIGFLLEDLVLLCPYLQSGFDSRPGHHENERSLKLRRFSQIAPFRSLFSGQNRGKVGGVFGALWGNERTAANSSSRSQVEN